MVIVAAGLQTPSITLDQDSSLEKQPKSDRLVLHAGRDLLDRLKFPKVGKPLALGAILVRFFCF